MRSYRQPEMHENKQLKAKLGPVLFSFILVDNKRKKKIEAATLLPMSPVINRKRPKESTAANTRGRKGSRKREAAQLH